MKNNAALDRRMVRKRHKLTFGYLLFYSVCLAGTAWLATILLGDMAGNANMPNIPKFLHNSVIGMLYIYNAVGITAIWFFTFLLPSLYQFKGLQDNSWNMLFKLDIKPSGLATNKIQIGILSKLGIYIIGFLMSTGLGFLIMEDKSTEHFITLIYLALFGILALLLVISPTLAVGAITKGKALLRLTIFFGGGIALFLAYSCGYFNCAAIDDVIASTAKMISFYPLGFLIIPILFAIIFPIITYTTAVSRARNYNIEELDDDLLVSLGVAEDMLVLEEGRNRFNVAISGPDVNDVDIDIGIPDLPRNIDDSFGIPNGARGTSQPRAQQRNHPSSRNEGDAEEHVMSSSSQTGRKKRGRRNPASLDETTFSQYESYDEE